MTTIPDTTVAQILAQAPSPQVASAMLLGSSFEGGWGPTFAEGDQQLGGSFGPFAILLEAHPGVTAAQAADPAFAVSYMLPSYEAAVSGESPALWQTNPELAAEQAAYRAERPAQDYLSAWGQARVDTDWAKVQGALKGADPATGTGTTAGTSTGSTGIAAQTTGIVGDILGWTGLAGDLKKAGAYLALVGAGLGLVVVGAVKTASPGTSIRSLPGKAWNSTKQAATLAATAA